VITISGQLESRRTRLEGDVVLRDAGFLHYAGYLLPLAVLPMLVATLFWSYARVQSAPGWLTTSDGLVLVRAGRAGTLDELAFREGDYVKTGSVVANVRVEQGHATLGETVFDPVSFIALTRRACPESKQQSKTVPAPCSPPKPGPSQSCN